MVGWWVGAEFHQLHDSPYHLSPIILVSIQRNMASAKARPRLHTIHDLVQYPTGLFCKAVMPKIPQRSGDRGYQLSCSSPLVSHIPTTMSSYCLTDSPRYAIISVEIWRFAHFMPWPYDSGAYPVRPVVHRKATACPCLDCIRSRVASKAIEQIAAIGRFACFTDWVRWRMRRERVDWPSVATMPEEMIRAT